MSTSLGLPLTCLGVHIQMLRNGGRVGFGKAEARTLRPKDASHQEARILVNTMLENKSSKAAFGTWACASYLRVIRFPF